MKTGLKAIVAVALVLIPAALLVSRAPAEKLNDDGSVEMRLITYNVCGLPDAITRERNLPAAKKRLPWIGKKLREYDVIGLQEMFIPDRGLIEAKLIKHYVAHGTDSPFLSKPGSGIYVFSKWGIRKSFFEAWEESVGYDSWSHKGFVGATIDYHGKFLMDVYSLHAQAGDDEYRMRQFGQLARALKRYSFGTGRPVVLLGDFNCEMGEKECDWLVENAGLTVVNRSPGAIDHIFYNENGSAWKITVLSSGWAFNKPVQGQMPSDHEAYEAVLEFRKK